MSEVKRLIAVATSTLENLATDNLKFPVSHKIQLKAARTLLAICHEEGMEARRHITNAQVGGTGGTAAGMSPSGLGRMPDSRPVGGTDKLQEHAPCDTSSN